MANLKRHTVNHDQQFVNVTPPLERYCKEAPSAVMREIAAIALAKRFRQRSLAGLLGISAPALIKRFATKKPRERTLNAFARTLQVPPEYFALLSASPKSRDPKTRQGWTVLLWERLQQYESRLHELAPGASAQVRTCFSGLPKGVQERVIDVFTVGECRVKYLAYNERSRDWFLGNYSMELLAGALKDHINLRSLVAKIGPNEKVLFELWVAAKTALEYEDVYALLNYAESMLRYRRRDVEAMQRYLHSDESYKHYHKLYLEHKSKGPRWEKFP